MKPVVALTVGDFNGIGPEVALKGALHPSVRRLCTPLLVGPPAVFEFYARRSRIAASIRPLDGTPAKKSASRGSVELPCVESSSIVTSSIRPGLVTRLAGATAAQAVETAVRLVQIGVADAMVTAPVSKRAMHLAGVNFPGQTEMVQRLSGAPRVVMMLVCSALRVGLITIHVPVSQIARRITPALLRERIRRHRRRASDRLGNSAAVPGRTRAQSTCRRKRRSRERRKAIDRSHPSLPATRRTSPRRAVSGGRLLCALLTWFL